MLLDVQKTGSIASIPAAVFHIYSFSLMETTLHKNIMKSFIEENGIGDSASMIITGTQVIPEFPIGMVIVLSGALAMSTALMVSGKRMR